jgi:hypothetical protein
MWPEVEAKTLTQRKPLVYMFFNYTSREVLRTKIRENVSAYTLTRLNCMKQKYVALSEYLNHLHPSVLCSSNETWRRIILSRSTLTKGEKARLQECVLHSYSTVLHSYSAVLHCTPLVLQNFLEYMESRFSPLDFNTRSLYWILQVSSVLMLLLRGERTMICRFTSLADKSVNTLNHVIGIPSMNEPY